MAANVIALMGQVTRAHTAELLGIDFSDWKLRKDDPGTPGSSVRGYRSRKRENFVLVCASLADLERAGQLLAHEGYSRRLVVVVDETTRPDMVSLRLGDLPTDCDVSLQRNKRGFIFAAESVSCSLDIGRIVSSLVAPAKGIETPIRVAVQDASLVKLAGVGRSPGIGLGSVSREPDSIPPYDLFLAHSGESCGSSLEDEERAVLQQVGIPVVEVDVAKVQPVDLRWSSPVGFDATPQKSTVDLTLERVKHRLLLTTNAAHSHAKTFDISAGLTENAIADLHLYRDARILDPSSADAQDLAGLLAAFGCAGIPLQVRGLHEEASWGAALPLRPRFTMLADVDLSDDLARQQWSVETRRIAMGHHALQRTWEKMVGSRSNLSPNDSVSVLVPSRRPEFIESIVRQVIQQSHSNREALVGLHGMTVGRVFELAPWLREQEGVSFVELPADLSLGQVLRRLTAQASGDFIAKMDDDDLYTEHHLSDLLLASRYSEAELVGCKAEFVYLEEQNLTIQRRPNSEIYGGSVTGGTLLLARSTLQAAGGWSEVGTAEDRLLQEAIGALGGRVYRSHGLNYLMRRGDGTRIHTWNPDFSLFEKQAIRRWDGLGYPGWQASGHV